MMGTLSKNVEISPKHISQDRTSMSDADLAADLLDELIGYRGVREPIKAMLDRAYDKLSRKSPKWTRRRVRAIFNKEANRIENREISDLEMLIAERERHAAYKAETARMAQMAVAPATNIARRYAPKEGSQLS
ncbi:hypothetical protein FHY56_04250 [Brucella gallinifaecis]|uniref:Uncharacterized protein n=2 Tax=Brucella gallinifaecis TaxID=215590 RepID=A0A502BRC1_9HYPH|nr:hypothetical protein FHY56_04250 [Brucella gallinifaecis]